MSVPAEIEPGLYWCRVIAGDRYDAILEIYGKPPFLKRFVHRLNGAAGSLKNVTSSRELVPPRGVIVIGPAISTAPIDRAIEIELTL